MNDQPDQIQANKMVEVNFTSTAVSSNPFMDTALDVQFTAPDGSVRKVPAFWAGGDQWRVRYSSLLTGRHTYQSICSNTDDAGLQDISGHIDVTTYTGDNPLYRHGQLRVSDDQRHFEHVDGTL